MAKKTLKSLADLEGQLDFTDYYKALEEAKKPKNMYDFGFDKETGNSALNKNQGKHRAKQYTLEMDIEEDEEVLNTFMNQFGDEHNNKVLARHKKRYKG